jgi:hypothetical protein
MRADDDDFALIVVAQQFQLTDYTTGQTAAVFDARYRTGLAASSALKLNHNDTHFSTIEWTRDVAEPNTHALSLNTASGSTLAASLVLRADDISDSTSAQLNAGASNFYIDGFNNNLNLNPGPPFTPLGTLRVNNKTAFMLTNYNATAPSAAGFVTTVVPSDIPACRVTVALEVGDIVIITGHVDHTQVAAGTATVVGAYVQASPGAGTGFIGVLGVIQDAVGQRTMCPFSATSQASIKGNYTYSIGNYNAAGNTINLSGATGFTIQVFSTR